MANYQAIIFDLYNTILDDDQGFVEREKYRIDTIYTTLEKALFPIPYSEVQEKYGMMTLYMSQAHETGKAVHPFHLVNYLLDKLNVHDVVITKKVYDAFADAVLQINPKPIKNVEKALKYLKEKGKKVGLLSNTGKTPGHAIRMLLLEMGLQRYFDDMIFSDEVGFLKPQKVIFELAVQRLDVDKEQTIFIGDLKYNDYDGAINAGLNAHLFDEKKDDLYQLAIQYCGSYE